MTRIRKIKNRDLPPNLYKRNGYYSYRDPRTRKEYGLGRNKAYAINEAISANQLLLKTEKVKPLTERIDGQGTVYFHEFLDRYEEILKTRGLREKTLKDYKQRIGVIRKGFVNAPIQNITTKQIADFLYTFIREGKITTAKILRVSLIDCFKEASASGLIQLNPAELTKTPKIKIQRARLSLNDFNTILSLINDDHHWLSQAMKLALVTGQRVSDIAKMKWKDIYDGKLWIIQQKTETKIAIPLDLGGSQTILISSTSDQPAVDRCNAALVATTVAEYFRDQNKHVILFIDSITRYCRALRDVALASGELPARKGFPASVFEQLPTLLERPGNTQKGALTAFYTILLENEEEPDAIGDEIRSILDGHIYLSQQLAAQGHYPAIDILRSTSRLFQQITEQQQQTAARNFRHCLTQLASLKLLQELGEYRTGENDDHDQVIKKKSAIEQFLQQSWHQSCSFSQSVKELYDIVA